MRDLDPDKEQGPVPRSREAVDWWLKKWGRQSVVNRKEPLNRRDIERLIEVNGGPAEELCLRHARLRGADLSWMNLQGADMTFAYLQDANLTEANLQSSNLWEAYLEGADLSNSNLQGANLMEAILVGANLSWANLQGAVLWDAHLEGADLSRSNLQDADFEDASLEDARLVNVKISPTTNLRGVIWGKGDKYYVSVLERSGHYEEAIVLYRKLKRWYEEASMLSIAGEFHYREREAARKAQWQELSQEFKGFMLGMRSAWRRLKSREDLAD